MSIFGEYVHLHWKNYLDHGVNRTDPKYKQPVDNKIFDAHANQINARLNSLAISPDKLKRLSDKYNTNLQKEYEFFKNLSTSGGKSLNDMQKVIAGILGTVNSRWSDPQLAEELARYISFNEATQEWIYNPPKGESATRYAVRTSFPPTPWKGEAGAVVKGEKGVFKDYHKVDTVLNYASKVYDQLLIMKEANIEVSADDLQQLNIKNRANDKTIVSVLQKLKESSTSMFDKENYQLVIHNQKLAIDSIVTKYASITEINRQINAALAEILGNITIEQLKEAQKKGGEIVINEIVQMMKQGIAIGRTQTQSSGMPNIVKLNFHEASIEYANKNSENKKSIFSRNSLTVKNPDTGKDEIQYSYEFRPLGGAVDQKTDIEFKIDGNQYNISMKNIDLSKIKIKDSETTIGAQNSSLMLYLLGIEQQQARLGTHYLNILAHNPNKISGSRASDFHKLRADANKSLRLYIAYSALTGEGQLRKTGFANVFAVHDKQKAKGTPFNRVKFYDIPTLVNTLSNGENDDNVAIKFTPAIQSLTLKNIKEPYVVVKKHNMAPSRRITKVLVDARTKNIDTSIKIRILKNLSEQQLLDK